MARITKKSLNAFIEESASQFKQTKEEYLNTTAKNCFVIIDEEKNPVVWDDKDYNGLMIFNDKNNAEAEAEPTDKIITEYEFYVMKKVI